MPVGNVSLSFPRKLNSPFHSILLHLTELSIDFNMHMNSTLQLHNYYNYTIYRLYV